MNDFDKLLKYSRILRKKPFILPFLLKNFTAHRVFNKNVLCTIDLALTYKCQASCGRCSCHPLSIPVRKEFTVVQMEGMLGKAKQAGVYFVNLTGGEPLLRPELPEIIRIIRKMNFLISLSSNAMLLDNALLRQFKADGLDVLQVSLEGPYAHEHDKYRGMPGNFAQVLAALDQARSLGVITLINTVATSELLNSSRLDLLLKIAQEYNCFLSFILPVSLEGSRDNTKAMLQERDYKKITELRRLPFVTSDMETSFYRNQCPAGIGKAYISPYGDVYPCPFIHRSQGNFINEDFISIWTRMAMVRHSHCVGMMSVE